jgi:hypothetical protein
VQERLKQTGSYATLFARKELERLRDYGDYLRPGSGMTKAFESITFYLTFAGLTLLHLLWYFLFFAFVLITLIVIAETLPPVPDGIMQAVILSTAATLFCPHAASRSPASLVGQSPFLPDDDLAVAVDSRCVHAPGKSRSIMP